MSELKKLDPSLCEHYEKFDFNNLHDNFYDVDKERLLQYKSIKERLSDINLKCSSFKTFESFLKKAYIHLTRISYHVFSFITNEKDYNVNFNINSDSSYCSLGSNFIQISTKILTNEKIPIQNRVDIVTGIIFHEYYHKRFTIDPIVTKLKLKNRKQLYEPSEHSPKDLSSGKTEKLLDKLFPDQLFSSINNILEDRRIEKLGCEDFPGYVFHFELLRQYAYYLHSSKQFSFVSIENILLDYILIKILLPELEENYLKQINEFKKNINKVKTDTVISPEGIKEFEEQLERILAIIKVLKYYIETNDTLVLSKEFEDIYTATKKIHEIIPKEIRDKLNETLKQQKYINITVRFGIDNENEDSKQIEIDPELAEELQKIIQKEIIKINIENTTPQEDLKIHVEKVPINNKFKNIKEFQIITQPIPMIDQKLLNDAKRNVKSIFNNLGFLDSKYSRMDEIYELTEGDLDESELHSISFNKNIFESVEPLPFYSLDFFILLDESGSMTARITEAKTAVLSLLLSLKDNKHINVAVYGHSANDGRIPSGSNKIQIYKYYNSFERDLRWERIFAAKSRSNNADGFAIEKIGEYIKQTKSKNKILCVVSDGQPAASDYGGELAEQHVKSVVETLEKQGIIVIQICMAHIENSPKMFSNYIPYDKNGKFFQNMKNILLKKMIDFSNI